MQKIAFTFIILLSFLGQSYSQLKFKKDTILYPIFDLGESFSTKNLVYNKSANTIPWKFKINRISVPSFVSFGAFDGAIVYAPGVSSCSIASNVSVNHHLTGDSLEIGFRNFKYSSLDSLPWFFSYDIYTAPTCDSLLSRFYVKIDMPSSSYSTYTEESNIFPNPFYDHLTISNISPAIQQVYITDLMGNVVYKNNIDEASENLQVEGSSWPSGLYILCRKDMYGKVVKIDKILKL
jgi:Secretion system C-terminal sorting domain